MKHTDQDLSWILKHLEDKKDSDFYGSVVINFKAGEVYLVREERTIKPPKNGYRGVP